MIYSGNGSVTVTEKILEESVEHIQVYTRGNCSVFAGTPYVVANTTTTEYLLPSQASNSTENPQVVTATVITVSSYIAGINSTDFTSVSFNIHDYGNANLRDSVN